MQGSIQSVEVSYMVHATEDGDKILNSVKGAFGLSAAPLEEVLQGHHGNAITRVRIFLTGDAAAELVAQISSGLSASSRARMKNEIESMLDEHSALFLRFDKQKLIEGKMVLAETDPVRIRVKPRLRALGVRPREFFLGVLKAG